MTIATRGWIRARRWAAALRQRESDLALVLSLVVGAVVGVVVVAFIVLTGRLATHLYPPGGWGWRRVIVPVVGSLASGYLLWRFFPFARGSGIPQTKAALFIHDGRISLRTVVGKFVCCSLSLASGIALGREGPSVQIGAGLASVIGRRLRLSKKQVRWLLPVGTSAALAAAFNTPIAAVLFSLEEIMGDLHAPVLGSVVLSSATSWMVLHLLLGDEPLFHVTGYHLVHPVEFLAYAVLGIVGGIGAVGFVKLLLGLRRRFLALPRSTAWLQPVVGGLMVGLIGYFVPQVLGVGYDVVERVLAGGLALKVMVLLAALKLVATAVCYASGNAGGIFGPSLFIGAMIGGAVGHLAGAVFPGHVAGPGAYALVGMGAAFAGIVRAPMTSVIMIFEVTRDYAIIVPLMLSNLIAYFVAHRLQPEPIYEALARQDGIHLPTAASHRPRVRNQVATAMKPSPPPLSSTMSIRDAVDLVAEHDLAAWPVVDEAGLRAMIRTDHLMAAIASSDQTVGSLLDRPDLARKSDGSDFLHLHPDQSLHLALERMGAANQSVLPVVSRANVRQLLGLVALDDVLAAYGVRGPNRHSAT